MKTNTIIQGDCLSVMRDMDSASVDTIITDPPYGLSFMGKKWDYDVPAVEVWVEALRVLKPGGTLLCFAGTRTYHRMVCNIEDAGFIPKDCIMWLYGSGFPKATDISKQLDKGHERKVIDRRDVGHDITNGGFKDGKAERKIMDITEPCTEEAQLWNGWKSHGLKPAYEPILVAMKPNEGTYANNARVHGVSGLNIDGGRIPTEDNLNGGEFSAKSDKRKATSFEIPQGNGEYVQPTGRYPANIILDEEAGAMLDEQTGSLQKSKGSYIRKNGDSQFLDQMGSGAVDQPNGICDKGGASRFFYCAKASKKERNAGCEGLETKDNLGYEVDPEHPYKSGHRNDNNANQLYMGITGKPPAKQHNHHPTVKPIALMEYLCTLTKTPTGGIVLDPFSGSGTTAMACVKTDREYIGIEREVEYCEIARKRVQEAKDSMGLFK